MPHGSHIQLHRSAVEGATPNVATMLEGEPAVNLADKKLYIKGATGELITLIGGVSAQHVAGSSGQIQFNADSGFSANPNFVINSSQDPPKIGIGTSSPREALEVQGTILAAGVSGDGATFTSCTSTLFTGNLIGTVIGNASTSSEATVAISASAVQLQGKSDNKDYNIIFADHNQADTTANLAAKVDGGSSGEGLIYNPGTDTLQTGNVHAIGISGDGATFGAKGLTVDGDLYLGNQSRIRVQGDAEAMYLNAGGGQLQITYTAVDIAKQLRHSGDANTMLEFTTDNVSLQAGGTNFLESNASGTVHVPVGISGGGATLSGDLLLGQSLVHLGDTDTRIAFADNQLSMQAGSFEPTLQLEANHKITMGDVSEGANGTRLIVDDDNESVTVNAAQGLLVSDEITHVGDTNTKIAFSNDNIQLRAGNTKFLESNATGVVHVPVGISGGGATFGINGITVEGNINLSGNLILAEDQNIQIGGDTEKIVFAGSDGHIELQSNEVLVDRFITHRGDTDTHFEFNTDEFNLTAGGKDAIIVKGADGLLHAPYGISGGGATFGISGITVNGNIHFSDATVLGTATRTDSYTGHIETASDKTYTLDPFVSTARTITGYFIKSGSGTVTATLKNATDTVKAASVSTTSGEQTSLSNTSVAAGATLSIVTSSNSSATDVVFNIEYTTTS